MIRKKIWREKEISNCAFYYNESHKGEQASHKKAESDRMLA